jgi:hypothetical protein
MRHLKIFEDFNKEESEQEMKNLIGTIEDSLSDLEDDGFSTGYGFDSTLFVNINKPGTEFNRQTFLGFTVDEIKGSVDEMISQLSTQRVYDISFHIKGYETNTWYSGSFDKNSRISSLSEVTFGMGENDKIDKFSIEFVPTDWKPNE